MGMAATHEPSTGKITPEKVSAQDILNSVLDRGSFIQWDAPERTATRDLDPDYADSLARASEKTGLDEAIVSGEGTVDGRRVAVICSEFGFLGGSVGAETARRLIIAIERATDEGLPLLLSPTSGGTRMQEGTPAFAMMISISAAVTRHKDARLPFLVYLRNPTTGGVMASWGSAGHLTFAQPGALLGFLGPRVVEMVTGVPIPEGVQTAENLQARGIIDGVISLSALRGAVRQTVDVLMPIVESPPKTQYTTALPDGRSAWSSILRTREPSRPSGGDIIALLEKDSVPLSGTGDGHRDDTIKARLARIAGQPVVIIAQDRHAQLPLGEELMGPGALRFAQRAIRLAESLCIPVVTVIDTPGAELTIAAEERAMAGEIARTLTSLLDVDVPSVSLILGQGCGGGALALLPADTVLAFHDAWLSPLPPEGASAIVYRDTDHAAEMMEDQGVAAEALAATGVVGVLLEEPEEVSELPERALEAIATALTNLSENPTSAGREGRLESYRAFAFLS